MHRTEASIEIARAPDVVFPWLVQPELRLKWIDGLAESEEVGHRRVREVIVTQGIRAELDVEVRTLDPPRLIELHVHSKMFEADVRTDVTAAGAVTRVASTAAASYRGFVARAAAPMITRQAQASLERSFARLKELVEAGA